MGLILDTSALVAWERAEKAGQTIALDGSEELVMPAVVWAEALAGVRLAMGSMLSISQSSYVSGRSPHRNIPRRSE